MKPVRIGIDIVSIDKVRNLVSKHYERVMETVFCREDLDFLTRLSLKVPDWGVSGKSSLFRDLAVKYAAKEATVKVLSPDQDHALELSEIVISGLSQIQVELSEELMLLARRQGIRRVYGSGAACRSYATAIVIGESDEQTGFR